MKNFIITIGSILLGLIIVFSINSVFSKNASENSLNSNSGLNNREAQDVKEDSDTYSSTNQESDTNIHYSPQTFDGNPCTVGCSGHKAGYDWAEENDITDPDDCGGNSDSFIEGCESYAENYLEENDEYSSDYE